MLGIIRVLTTDQQEILQEHGRIMKETFGIQATTRCIDDQPNGIYDDASEKNSVPKIVRLAKDMEANNDIQAITISCASDPAIDEVRACVEKPVLGAGECGAHMASMVGNKVGVIGIKDTPPAAVQRALGEKFFAHASSPNLRKTTDLSDEDAKEELRAFVDGLINKGADVILFACTGFSTIGLKEYLREYVHVPIIDLVEAQATAYNQL